MMIQWLHGAVFFVGSLIAVGYGDEVTTDLCRQPNGVFPNPEDCSSFISCSNGQHYVEKCPDGLLYNPSRSTCDFNETGDCASSDDFEPSIDFVRTDDIDCSPEGPNIYPVPSSCSDYYLCDDGEPFRVECPSGLHMNRDTLTCDHPENVNCDVDTSADNPTVGVTAIYESNGGDAEVIDELETTTTESSDTSSSAQPVETSPLVQVNTISTKDTATETVYDVKIPTTTKPSVTESTTLHQTTLMEKETSTAVSVTEYTVNKQPTVITVSTEQTKEGSNENDAKETTSKSELEISTMSPTSIYITTIDDQATSSDTTNPYPDLTNSEEHSTQAFTKQPKDSTLSTYKTSSVASVSDTNTPDSMQQTSTDSSEILSTDFEISSDADDGSLQSSASDLNLTEIPITDRNYQSTPRTNTESVSLKEYTSEADSTLEENTTSGMKDATGISSIVTSESPINFTTTITKLENVTSQEKVTSSKVTSDVPVTDPTAFSREYKTTRNSLEETTTADERKIVTEGITSMTDEKLSSSFPTDKTKSEMEETDTSYRSTVNGSITSTDDFSNSVVTDASSISVNQNETTVESSATTKPTVSENESSTSQSEISSELTTKDTVYTPDDATQTTVHLKTTETENSHSSDINSTTVKFTETEPVGTDGEMKLSTTLKPIDPLTTFSTSEQSSSSVNTESDPNTVISSSTFTTGTGIAEITRQPSESLDDHDTKNTRSELFTTDAPTDDKITPEKTMGTSQGLMSSDPSTDNEMSKFVTSNYSTMTTDTIQTNNEISSEDLMNLTSNEITEVSFSTETSDTISSGNETDQPSSDGFKNDTTSVKSTSYFIAEESTTETKDLTSNNLLTESILTKEPKILTETATSINMLTTNGTMGYFPISSTDLTSVSDVSLPSSSGILTKTPDSSESLPSETSSFENLTSVTPDKMSTAVEFASTKESPLTSAEQTFPISETDTTEQEKITLPSTEITRSDTTVVTTAKDNESTTDTFPEDTSDVPKNTTKSDFSEGTESDMLTNDISNTPVSDIATNSDDLHVFTEDPSQNTSITFKDDASQSTFTSNSIKTTDITAPRIIWTKVTKKNTENTFEASSHSTKDTDLLYSSTTEKEATTQTLSPVDITTQQNFTSIPSAENTPEFKGTTNTKLFSLSTDNASTETTTFKHSTTQSSIPSTYTDEPDIQEELISKSTKDFEPDSLISEVTSKATDLEETSISTEVTRETFDDTPDGTLIPTHSIIASTFSSTKFDDTSPESLGTTISQKSTSDVEPTLPPRNITVNTTLPEISTSDKENKSTVENITKTTILIPQTSTPDTDISTFSENITDITEIISEETISDVKTTSIEITERTMPQKSTSDIKISSTEITTEITTTPLKSTSDVETTSSLEIETERITPLKSTSGLETSSLEIVTESSSIAQKSTSDIDTSSLEIKTGGSTTPQKSTVDVETTSSPGIITEKTNIPQKSTSDVETSLEITTERTTIPQKSTYDVETSSLEIATERTTISQKSTPDVETSLEIVTERTTVPQKSTSDVETTSSLEIKTERTTIPQKFSPDVETSSLEIVTERTTIPQKSTFDVETSSLEIITGKSTIPQQFTPDEETTSSLESKTERTTIPQKSTSDIETISSLEIATGRTTIPQKSTPGVETSSFEIVNERTTISHKFTSDEETNSSLENITESTTTPEGATSEVEISSLSENITGSITNTPQKSTFDVETTSFIERMTDTSTAIPQTSTDMDTTSSIESITEITILQKSTSKVETTMSPKYLTESSSILPRSTSEGESSSLSENLTESITITPQKPTFDVDTTSSIERMTDTPIAIPQTSTDVETSSVDSITERTTILQEFTSEVETSSLKNLTESTSIPPKSTSEVESSSPSGNVTESRTSTPQKPTFDVENTSSIERMTNTPTAIPQTSINVETTFSVESITERTTIPQKSTSEVETSSLKYLTETTSIPPKSTSEVESSSFSENATESIMTIPQKYTSDVETTSSVASITETPTVTFQKSTSDEKTTSSLENITGSDVTNSDYMHSTGITLDTTIGISERSTTISSTNLEDITIPTNQNDETPSHTLSTVTSDYSHTNGLTSDTTDFDSTTANFRTKTTTIESSKASEEMFTISLTSDFTSENEKISTASSSIDISDITSLKTEIVTNEPITTDVHNSSYLPSEISTQDREPTFSTSQTIYQSTNYEDPTDIPATSTEFSTSYLSTERPENLTESTEIGSSKYLSSTYSISKYSLTEPQTTILSTTDENIITDSTIYEASTSWRPSKDTSTEIITSTIKGNTESSTVIPTDLTTLIDIETSSKLDTTTGLQTISTTSASSETTTLTQICIEANGFYPNSEDCNTFYQCSKGVPKLSSCTENNHFNPVLKRCEDPCRAKCDPSLDCPSRENESSSEGTTSQLTTTENILRSTTEDYSVITEIPTRGTRPADDLISVPDSTFETTPTDSKYFSTRESTSESEVTSEYTSLPTTQVTTEYSSILTDASTSEEYSTSLDPSTTEVRSSSVTYGYRTSVSTEHTDKMDDTTESLTSRAPVSETESTTVTEAIKSTTPGITNTYTDESIEQTSSQYETTFTQDVSSYSTGGYTIVSSVSTHKDTEEPSSTSTFSASITPTTVCENNDCLSSKVPAASTPVPYTVCHRNDFLSRPSCNEYMDCTEKFPQKKRCPMGLYFNPTTRVCDWPHSAECGQMPKPLYKPDNSFECPCKSCLIPSKESCSHYYLCLGYTAYHMKCSNSLLFDKKLNTCNYAITVECLGSTSTTDSTVPTKPSTISTTKTTYITTTRRPPTSSTTVKPERFVCPRREGLFKYPGNCGRFYQCSNWYPYKMSCPVTTHFSEITERCEYPCDAKCDLSISCGESSTPSNDPRCICHNCKLPSAETCTKYIVCVNGKARLENCPWGQTFDARREHCDWAHKVQCRHSEMCPELSGVFPHKDDCHKFVHCSNGIPYVKKCPSVLEFDAEKKRCEWPSGRCQHSLIPKEFMFREKEHREGWRCPKAFGYFADEHHCNRFYHCSLGTPYMKECPEGLLYNPRQQTCDWKKHARCNSNRRQLPKRCRAYDRHVICKRDRMPQSHAHCNMYYDCNAGRACAKQCPIGLYFNRTTGICDLPANVRCFHERKEYSLKEISASCLSSDNKRTANPTDDSCFYRCRQGTLIHGCCSRGHVYNQHRDECERKTKSFRI